MLEASVHSVIRGAIDADTVESIISNLSPYMKSHDGWCTSVQFNKQVLQKPILFQSFALLDVGLITGSSINNIPFFLSWLQDIIRLSFPHLKFCSIFLLKNNRNTTKWEDVNDTSGIDKRHDVPMVLWFSLERSVALDYKQHTKKKHPQPKVTSSSLDLKPMDLLMFDCNTFLHWSSRPIYPKYSNFRVLIILSTHP
jgi:hypothetical protein